MKGKYKDRISFGLARIHRELIRRQLKPLVQWSAAGNDSLVSGCTVIVGVCSGLPMILKANLRCLLRNRWEGLKETLLIVDGPEGILPKEFIDEALREFQGLHPKFLYYSKEQHKVCGKIKLPWVYAWLSWCLGLKEAKTQTVLIHDYDALILSPALGERYAAFQASEQKMQGIKWYGKESDYSVNGICREDRLLSTFETFLRTSWIRSFEPIMLLNRIACYKGRTVDFDILSYIQADFMGEAEKKLAPMGKDDLVHPSQMIDLYNRYRYKKINFHAKPWPACKWPCYSVPMIPLFFYLSGETGVFSRATAALRKSRRKKVELLDDNVFFDFSMLTAEHVCSASEKMLRAVTALSMPPPEDLLEYVKELYKFCGASEGRSH